MSMLWILLFPLNIITSILCYLTNPIAVLFADERGELHGLWRYWQTWDDSCDVDWIVKTRVPKIFMYDFDKHYVSSRETTPELTEVGRDKGCVIFNPANPDAAKFTIKERIQRYFCRLFWLNRNNGYGWAFFFFGRNVIGTNMVAILDKNTPNDHLYFGYDKSKNILVRPWIFKTDWTIYKTIRWNTFLGWKIDCSSTTPRKAMIANRIAISID